MASVAQLPDDQRRGAGLAGAVAAGLGAVLVAVTIGAFALGLPESFAAVALAAYAAGACAVVGLALARLEAGPFGAANTITLARGALIAPLLGLLGAPRGPSTAWFAIALAVVALVLDGLDGWAARRGGRPTRFGSRFDMETDALLILVVALLCWRLDKAGAWVLAAGLMRYAFVAAGWLLPWLRAELPPSRRRQTVCVVQVVSLLACLAPFLTGTASALAAAAGLAALAGSFLADVAWLARARVVGSDAGV